jgi:tetratricopeptide (TPR) repeat protein
LTRSTAIKHLLAVTIAVMATGVLLTANARTGAHSGGGAQRSGPKASAAFNDLAKRANEARENGRLDEAITFYGEALKIRQKWDEGWWYLATLLYDRDNYADARDAFRTLASHQPKNGPAFAMLGLCEFRTREYDDSLAHLQRARALGIGDNAELTSVVRFHTGILLTRYERFEPGYDALLALAHQHNESLSVIEAFGLNVLRMPLLPSEMPPDRRELVLMAGRAAYYAADRRAADAKKAFEDVVARYPEAPNLHYAYGVYLLPEEPDAALREFRRQLEISPNDIYCILQIAFEYIRRSDYPAGLPFAQKAVELAPKEAAPHNALGRILLETGEMDRAITELELAVKLAPDSPQVHFALAHAYSRAGRKDDAARERAIFLRLDNQSRAQGEGAPPPEGQARTPNPGEKALGKPQE